MKHLILAALVAFGLLTPAPASGELARRDELLELAKKFPSAKADDAERAVDVVLGVTTDKTEAEALVLQGYFESLWGKLRLGDCTCFDSDGQQNDCPDLSKRTLKNCKSFGAMQVQGPERWLAGATPAKVVADLELGYRVGLEVWRWAYEQCDGDRRRALGLYMTGKGCGAAPEKTARRAKYVGW